MVNKAEANSAPSTTGDASTSRDLQTWRIVTTELGTCSYRTCVRTNVLAFGAGTWLLGTIGTPNGDRDSGLLFSNHDPNTWTANGTTVPGRVLGLAFGAT